MRQLQLVVAQEGGAEAVVGNHRAKGLEDLFQHVIEKQTTRQLFGDLLDLARFLEVLLQGFRQPVQLETENADRIERFGRDLDVEIAIAQLLYCGLEYGNPFIRFQRFAACPHVAPLSRPATFNVVD